MEIQTVITSLVLPICVTVLVLVGFYYRVLKPRYEVEKIKHDMRLTGHKMALELTKLEFEKDKLRWDIAKEIGAQGSVMPLICHYEWYYARFLELWKDGKADFDAPFRRPRESDEESR